MSMYIQYFQGRTCPDCGHNVEIVSGQQTCVNNNCGKHRVDK